MIASLPGRIGGSEPEAKTGLPVHRCRSNPYLRRLVAFGEQCVVSPYVPHSWWHDFGRRAMVRRLERKGFPQLWGWLFVTFTIDQDLFEDSERGPAELLAYIAGNDRLRRVVSALREFHSIRRWFWKLELQENGWPHWHVGFDTREFIGNSDIADAWGLGFVKTKRVSRERDFRYLFKYVCKDGGEIPEWLANYGRRVRVFQTSVGFFGQVQKRQVGTKPSLPFEPADVQSLAEKFAKWSRRVVVRFRDASYRGTSAELSDSVESYSTLFISCVENGARALDAYHIAVSLESLQESVKPWQPQQQRNPRPLKLYPSTLWVPFRTGSTSLVDVSSRRNVANSSRTERVTLAL